VPEIHKFLVEPSMWQVLPKGA